MHIIKNYLAVTYSLALLCVFYNTQPYYHLLLKNKALAMNRQEARLTRGSEDKTNTSCAKKARAPGPPSVKSLQRWPDTWK